MDLSTALCPGILPILLTLQMRGWGTERARNLSKATQLARGTDEVQIGQSGYRIWALEERALPWCQKIWAGIQAPPFTTCVPSEKSLNLPEPWFSILWLEGGASLTAVGGSAS